MPRDEITNPKTDSSEDMGNTSTTSKIWKVLGVVKDVVKEVVTYPKYILPSTVRKTEEGMAENRRALDELKQKIDADALEVQHLVAESRWSSEESQRRSEESQRISEEAEQQLRQVRAQFHIPTNGNSKTSHTEAKIVHDEEAQSTNDSSLKQ